MRKEDVIIIKIRKLEERTRSGINIAFNKYKWDCYGVDLEKFVSYLTSTEAGEDGVKISKQKAKKIVKEDKLVEITFCIKKDNFHTVYHWDLEKALDECLNILTSNQPKEVTYEHRKSAKIIAS